MFTVPPDFARRAPGVNVVGSRDAMVDGRELLERSDAYKHEAQFLRDENRFLQSERDHYRREWFFTQ
jgi:hypothetical protein